MRHTLFLAVALLAIAPAAAQGPKPKAAAPCVEPAPTASIKAAFGPSVSLRDLVTWVAELTCKPVVYPTSLDKVAGTVTIAVPPGGLTPAKAMALFVEAVRATGVSVTIKRDAITLKLASDTPPPPRRVPDLDNLASADTHGWQEAIDGHTRLVDATHARVTRALVDKLLSDPMQIAKGARVVPSSKNGAPNGFKLYAIRPSSIFAKVGLANGDLITAINGNSMHTIEQAMEMYTRLRDATQLEIEIVRRGKPLTLQIDIVKSL